MATPPSVGSSGSSVPEGTLSLEEMDGILASPEGGAEREAPLSLEEMDAILQEPSQKKPEELPEPAALPEPEAVRPVVEIPAAAPPAEEPSMSSAMPAEGAAVSDSRGFAEPVFYESRKGMGAKRFDYAAYDTTFENALLEARELYRKNVVSENPLLNETEINDMVRKYEDEMRIVPRTRATNVALEQLQAASKDQTVRSKLLSLAFPVPRRVLAPHLREDPDAAWRRIARGGPTQRMTEEEARASDIPLEAIQQSVRKSGDFSDTTEVLSSLVNPDPEKNSAWIALKAAGSATGIKPFAAWLGNKIGVLSAEDYEAYKNLDDLAELNPALERAGDLLAAGRKNEAEAAFDDLSYNRLPKVLQPSMPDVQEVRKAFAEDPTRWMFDPEMRELAFHIGKASTDSQLQDVLNSMPQRVLKQIQPSVGLPRNKVGDAVRLYEQASKEVYGSGTVGKTFQTALVSNLYDTVQTSRGLVARPSALTHAMTVVGIPAEALWEAKLPLGTTLGIVGSAVAGPGLRLVGGAVSAVGGAVAQKGIAAVTEALGNSEAAAQIDNAYVPNKAGRDYMLASGAYDNALRSFGYDTSKKGSLRTEDLSWAGRVYANYMMPEYMGFGFLQTRRLAGLPEEGAAQRGALGADIAMDLLFMPEQYVAKATIGPVRAAARAYTVGNLMPEGMKLAGAFAAAAPELATRLRVTKAAAREGKTFQQALKEGTAAAHNANAITATFLSTRMGVDDAIRNGKNPMAMLEKSNPKLAESVRDIVRRAGFDPEETEGLLQEAVAGIDDAVMDGVDIGLRQESIGNKTGARLMDNVRNSASWRVSYEELNRLAQNGAMTPYERDAAMSLYETAAHTWAAVNDSTPQAFFGMTRLVADVGEDGRAGVRLVPTEIGYDSPVTATQYRTIIDALDELPEVITSGQRTTLDGIVDALPDVVEGIVRVDDTPDTVVLSHVQEKLLQAGEEIPELHLRTLLNLDDLAGADSIEKIDLVERLETVGRTVRENPSRDGRYLIEVFGPDGDIQASAVIAGIFDADGSRRPSLFVRLDRVPAGRSGVRPLLKHIADMAALRGYNKIAVAKTGNAALDASVESALFFVTNGNATEKLAVSGIDAIEAAVRESTQEVARNVFFPMITADMVKSGNRPSNWPAALKPSAGWKLHLDAASDVLDEMASWLDERGLFYKIGKSSEQEGKGATIYVGSRDNAVRLAKEIDGAFGPRLAEPAGDVLTDDAQLSGRVWGRFDAAGDSSFRQYGRGGVPAYLVNPVGTDDFSPQALSFSDRRLRNLYGSFYEGTGDAFFVGPAVSGINAIEATVRESAFPMGLSGVSLWKAGAAKTPIADVLSLAGDTTKSGVFRGFVDGDAATLRLLMGDKWTDNLLKNFAHDVDDVGRVRLTSAGVNQFDNAFADYLARPGRSTMRNQMSDFYEAMQIMYLRARGISEHPTFAQMQLDSVLRPDRLLRPKIAQMAESLLYRPGSVLYAGKDAADRMARQAKRLRGASREAYKVVGRPNELRELLGVSKGTRTIPVTDLYGQAIAHVLTEHARNRIGSTIIGTGITLKQVGTRSVVAAERVENVQKAVAGRLESMGLRAEEMLQRMTRDQTAYNLANDPGLQAALVTFVEDMKGSWYSDYLPAEVTSPRFDGSRISVDAYNKMILLLTDRLAGPGSFRSIAAEAVPVSVGYAIQESLLKAGRKLDAASWIMDKTKEIFVVPRVGEGILDPGIVEMLENANRRYAEIPNILRDATKKLRVSGSAATLPEFVRELRSLAVPPIEGRPLEKLISFYDELGYGVPVQNTSTLSGGMFGAVPTRAARVEEMLLDIDDVHDVMSAFRPAGMDTVSDLELSALQQGRRLRTALLNSLTPEESALVNRANAARSQARAGTTISPAAQAEIVEMHRIAAAFVETLPDEDKAILATVVSVLADGIERRGSTVVDRGSSILLAAFGGEDASQLLSLTRPDWKMAAYRNFYTGNWEGVFDVNNYLGLASHFEDAGKFATKYSQSTAGVAMIARMLALDIKAQLASDLVQYGVRADISTLTKDLAMTALSDRAKFVERVQEYAQDILTYASEDVRVAGPKSKQVYIPERQVKGPEDLAAYNKAYELLNSYGMKIAPAELTPLLLPDGTRVIIPRVVADELNSALLRNADVQGAYSLAEKLKLTRTADGENIVEVALTDAQKAEKWRAETARNTLAAFAAGAGAVAGLSFLGTTAGVVGGAVVAGVAVKNAEKVINHVLDIMPATYRQMNIGMTVGIGMAIHPAYFVANFFGGVFQSHLGLGPVQTTTMLFRNPRQTAAVMMELFAGDKFAFSAAPLITRDGRVYPMEKLARDLDAAGLSGSYLKAETALSIMEDIRLNEDTFWNKVVRPGRWLEQTVLDAAASVDNFWRVNVALDELAKGASLEEAAKMARAIAFDYSKATDAEKNVIRKAVMFYMFMRRNIDLVYDTAMRNPERVISQMRTIANANRAVLGEDSDLVAPDYMEGRLMVYARKTLRDKMDNKQLAILLPQIPLNDVMATAHALYSVPFDDSKNASALVTKVSPFVQAPFVFAMNRDLFSGRELSGPNAYNPVPSYLIEFDQAVYGGILSSLLDVEWRPMQDPSKSNSPEYLGYYHANNGFMLWLLRNVVQTIPGVPFGAGRALSTGEAWDRSGVGVIENLVDAARYYRENLRVEAVDTVLREVAQFVRNRGTTSRPGFDYADLYIPKGNYDNMVTPREGLSALDEFLSLLGIRAVRLNDPTLAQHELYYEATQKLKTETKTLRKANREPGE